MLLLNFTHPLTQEHRVQIEQLTGETIEEIREIAVQLDLQQPLAPQISTIVNSVDLTSQEWQTHTLLINPPGFAPAALVLVAEIHGRIGHFPMVLRLRPAEGPVTRFEIGEIMNLQHIRDESRKHR
jgi:hypothetical protein